MALNKQHGVMTAQVGLNNVGSYQVSGIPYITGSDSFPKGQEEKITFPYVARSVCVINQASVPLRIHFNSTGSPGNVISGLHYIAFDSHEDSYTFNVKCKEIYLSTPSTNTDVAKYKVVAELTNIPTGRMYSLSGSGLTD